MRRHHAREGVGSAPVGETSLHLALCFRTRGRKLAQHQQPGRQRPHNLAKPQIAPAAGPQPFDRLAHLKGVARRGAEHLVEKPGDDAAEVCPRRWAWGFGGPSYGPDTRKRVLEWP